MVAYGSPRADRGKVVGERTNTTLRACLEDMYYVQNPCKLQAWKFLRYRLRFALWMGGEATKFTIGLRQYRRKRNGICRGLENKTTNIGSCRRAFAGLCFFCTSSRRRRGGPLPGEVAARSTTWRQIAPRRRGTCTMVAAQRSRSATCPEIGGVLGGIPAFRAVRCESMATASNP